MPGLIIALVIVPMFFSFFVGLLLFVVGLRKRDALGQLTPIGLAIAGIPVSIVVLLAIVSTVNEHCTTKPSKSDLKGTYHIVKVRNLNIDESTFNNHTLQFSENGRFTLTPTPHIDVCRSGNYDVDFGRDLNELSLQCGSGAKFAHIDRGFGSFRIEFIIGDPDSGESIYFAKDDD